MFVRKVGRIYGGLFPTKPIKYFMFNKNYKWKERDALNFEDRWNRYDQAPELELDFDLWHLSERVYVLRYLLLSKHNVENLTAPCALALKQLVDSQLYLEAKSFSDLLSIKYIVVPPTTLSSLAALADKSNDRSFAQAIVPTVINELTSPDSSLGLATTTEMLLQTNMFDEALSVMQEMHRNNQVLHTTVYGKIFRTLVLAGRFREVVNLWTYLQTHDLKPNSFIFCQMIRLSGAVGVLDSAVSYYELAESSLILTQQDRTVVLTALLQAVLAQKSLDKETECKYVDYVLSRINKHQLHVSNELYSELMHIYSRSGDFLNCELLYFHKKHRHRAPTSQDMFNILQAYQHALLNSDIGGRGSPVHCTPSNKKQGGAGHDRFAMNHAAQIPLSPKAMSETFDRIRSSKGFACAFRGLEEGYRVPKFLKRIITCALPPTPPTTELSAHCQSERSGEDSVQQSEEAMQPLSSVEVVARARECLDLLPNMPNNRPEYHLVAQLLHILIAADLPEEVLQFVETASKQYHISPRASMFEQILVYFDAKGDTDRCRAVYAQAVSWRVASQIKLPARLEWLQRNGGHNNVDINVQFTRNNNSGNRNAKSINRTRFTNSKSRNNKAVSASATVLSGLRGIDVNSCIIVKE